MNRTRAILAGIMLAAIMAAPVSAATTGTITDSVSVNSTLAITGIPATFDYGALNPGVTSAVQTATLTVTGNADWALKVSGTDLVFGTKSIPNAARQGWVPLGPPNLESFGDNPTGGANAFGTAPLDGIATLAQNAAGTTVGPFEFKTQLNVPAGAKAGTYSGSITITVVVR